MNEFAKFLEEVKEKFEIRNDLQLSAFLGISTNMTYRMVRGLSIPGDENCIQIARVTGYDPAYIIALAHKSAAKRKDVTKEWDRILKLVPKGLTTGVLLAVGIALGFPGVAKAQQIRHTVTECSSNYTLSDNTRTHDHPLHQPFPFA
jgi:hypothetical protein